MTLQRYPDNFDELFTFDATFGPLHIAKVGETTHLIIPVVGLGLSEHPAHVGDDVAYLDQAFLVFEDCLSSKRRLKRYLTPKELAGEVEVVVDVDGGSGPMTGESFSLEGVCRISGYTFYALEWSIVAARFALVVSDTVVKSADPLTEEPARFVVDDDQVDAILSATITPPIR